MLRKNVVDAVGEGRFKIYAVSTIDEGMEILTGLPAGKADEKGDYPIGSINRAVANGLRALAKKARAIAREALGRGGRLGPVENHE